eukprot:PhM_4_TR7314/c0_g1_i1/m.69346
MDAHHNHHYYTQDDGGAIIRSQTQCSRLKINTRGMILNARRRNGDAQKQLCDATATQAALLDATQKQSEEISRLQGLEALRALQFIHAKLCGEVEREKVRKLKEEVKKARVAEMVAQREAVKYEAARFQYESGEIRGRSTSASTRRLGSALQGELAKTRRVASTARKQTSYLSSKVAETERKLDGALRHCDLVSVVMQGAVEMSPQRSCN